MQKGIKAYTDRVFFALNNRGLLRWVSDQTVAKKKYRRKMGQELQLDPPVTFNEKIQYLKLHDHNPRYTELVDKLAAKRVVGERIGSEYIVPLLGQWSRAEDIDFDALPERFVLKCSHDQGSVIVVPDKSRLDRAAAVAFLSKRLKRNNYWNTREYCYKHIEPAVLAEEFLGGQIRDYKFYCFGGTPRFLYVGQGLTADHSLRIDYFDMEWNLMPFHRTDYARLGMVEKPKHFETMKRIAEELSRGMPFVRIDLFEEHDRVYFSEFTLYPASGCMPFEPKEYDRTVGEWLALDQRKGE